MGKRHAVLISSNADSGVGYWMEFWSGAVLMWEVLEKHGFEPENVHVLYGDGANFSDPYYTLPRYQVDITDRKADSANVLAVLKGLADGSGGIQKMEPDDLLFIWVHTHGKKNADGTKWFICLDDSSCGDTIDDATFASYLNEIPHAFRVVCLNQCNAGGFIKALRSNKTVVLTACDENEGALYSDDPEDYEVDPSGDEYFLGEFTSHLFSALNGQTATGVFADADVDNNTVVTMKEAFDYIELHDDQDETPQYDDGQLELGKKLHLSFADVFMRDSLNDSGVEPRPGGPLFKSPDICHFQDVVPDPQGVLGASAVKNRDDLFETVDISQPNSVYARLQNRGYSKVGAKVTMYWTEASTRGDPGTWEEIGSVDVPEIEPGDFVVSEEIPWTNLPTEDGSYCLISILENHQDPPPDLAQVTDIISFRYLVSNNNNVTWKNFDIEDVGSGGPFLFGFSLEGLPADADRSRFRFDFSQLPDSARVAVRAPVHTVRDAIPLGFRPGTVGSDSTTFDLHGGQVASLANLNLRRGRRDAVSIEATIPHGIRTGSFEISVTEIQEGIRVGAVSKRFVISRPELFCDIRTRAYHRYGCERSRGLPRWRFLLATSPQIAMEMGFQECLQCRAR